MEGVAVPAVASCGLTAGEQVESQPHSGPLRSRHIYEMAATDGETPKRKSPCRDSRGSFFLLCGASGVVAAYSWTTPLLPQANTTPITGLDPQRGGGPRQVFQVRVQSLNLVERVPAVIGEECLEVVLELAAGRQIAPVGRMSARGRPPGQREHGPDDRSGPI